MGCGRLSVSSLSTPRLRQVDTAGSTPEVGDAWLALLHYTGKKQVNPPALLPVTSGPSYEEVTRTQTSLHHAQEKDAQWLNSLFQLSSPSPPMEWSGFNSQLAMTSAEIVKKQPSIYLLGPLINGPPAHPRHNSYICGLYDEIAARPWHDLHSTIPRYAIVHPGHADQLEWFTEFHNLILRSGVWMRRPLGQVSRLSLGMPLGESVASGWFLPFFYSPSCKLVSRHGRRYVNTWRGHGFIQLIATEWTTS